LNSTRPLKKNNTNTFQIERKETLLNSFHEAIITLIPKLDKNKTRKLQANLFNEHKCKDPQENIGKPNSITYQKQQYHDQLVSSQGCRDGSAYANH
jgi:hypothetical protein